MWVRLGMTRGFGASLQKVIAKSTKNRLASFGSGALVTMLVQSSMATILIVSSFASQGLLAGAAGLAAILGADVGTTIVAQVLTFDLGWVAPVLIIFGFIFYKRQRSSRMKNIGRILCGLAMMLFALAWIRESAEPLKYSETLPLILRPLENDAILAVIVSGLLTWIMHSSLAFVLLLVSMVSSGIISLDLGIIMVLGANLGGAIVPLIAAINDVPAAKRLPVGNFIMRITGVLLILPLAEIIQPYLHHIGADPGRQIVNFHTVFNIALALVFLPLLSYVIKLCRKIIPDRVDPDAPGQPKYLDAKALDNPSIALSSAVRETLRMADVLEQMLGDTLTAFKNNDDSMVAIIKEKDDQIDKLYSAIKNYMARLTEEFMDSKEAQRYLQILTFATNIEHSGDIIENNLMSMALKKSRNQQHFSGEGLQEIEEIHEMAMENLRMAQSVFVSEDKELARKLIKKKDSIRQAEALASSAHIERLREGIPESCATSSLHMDIIRDIRRINTYICYVAYSLLESGEEKKTGPVKENRNTGHDEDAAGDLKPEPENQTGKEVTHA